MLRLAPDSQKGFWERAPAKKAPQLFRAPEKGGRFFSNSPKRMGGALVQETKSLKREKAPCLVHSEADGMVPGSDVITQLLLTEDPQHAQGTLLRAAMENRAVELVNAAQGAKRGGRQWGASERKTKAEGKT